MEGVVYAVAPSVFWRPGFRCWTKGTTILLLLTLILRILIILIILTILYSSENMRCTVRLSYIPYTPYTVYCMSHTSGRFSMSDMADISTAAGIVGIVGIVSVPKRSALKTSHGELSEDVWFGMWHYWHWHPLGSRAIELGKAPRGGCDIVILRHCDIVTLWCCDVVIMRRASEASLFFLVLWHSDKTPSYTW